MTIKQNTIYDIVCDICGKTVAIHKDTVPFDWHTFSMQGFTLNMHVCPNDSRILVKGLQEFGFNVQYDDTMLNHKHVDVSIDVSDTTKEMYG